MIDFQKAKEAFQEYLQQYNLKDDNILLKVKHTYGVVEKSEYIARGLNLDEENIKLAMLIGLLHDIGRFEQVKRTSDFLDSQEFNHADYGVKVLFNEGLIRKFILETKYDNIIRKAIYYHNKYQLEGDLNELELLHSKIIRDADKLDNFRVKETEKFENMFPSAYNKETIYYDVISDKVYLDFLESKCIKIEDRKTQLDFWVCFLAFIFDLNFSISLKYIDDKKYIDILVDRIEYKNKDTKEKMEHIRKHANKYIKQKLEKK